MTTLATAQLPSDDEEDSDFDPDAVREEPAATAASDGAQKKGSKRKQVAEGIAAARASKQAKRVDDIWAQLRAQSGGSASTSAPSSAQDGRRTAADSHGADGSTAPVQSHRQQGSRLNLAAICRPVPKKQKGTSDESWKRQFGLASHQPPTAGEQQDAKAIAAAALEAAKAIATTDQYGRAVVTETRKFAGQSVQIKKSVAAGSAAKEAEKKATTGLDAMLEAIKGAKKVTVLDKSKSDWHEHKKEAGVEEDLAEHQRSSNRFLDKQDFLVRSEVREYEKERDARLNADVRNRSRA